LSLTETKPVHRRAETEFDPPVAGEVCADLRLARPHVEEIYPYLGYPSGTSPGPQIAEHVRRLVAELFSCLEPRGIFSVYQVTDRKTRSLRLGRFTVRGNIGEFLEHADRVAVFVVTAGEEVSTRSTSTRQGGDALAAWIVDAFGSWAAEAAADALMERVHGHLRDQEALTLRYSPGYCGMRMSQQRQLFRLVNAGSIGVKLLPSYLMQPLKSISGLVGLGPNESISSYRSPCDRCPQVGCHMRR
jgi:hypothetical protein